MVSKIILTIILAYISILSDFNADIQATSNFGAELIEFRDNNNLCFLDKELLQPDSFTY